MSARVVCIIDDDEEIIDLVRLILSASGYSVIGSSDGRAAVQLVQREQPDVVLLDVMMPDVDGWEVLDALRSNPASQHIPVTLLSGAKHASAASVGGIDAVVDKPFGPKELLEALQHVLGG